MSALDVITRLSKEGGSVDPVYVLYGPETFLIDLLVERIRETLERMHENALSVESLSGDETTPAGVAEAARTMPLFTRAQLVLVRKADKLNVSKAEPLERYFDAPNPATCLVLLGPELNSRVKLWAAMGKRGWLHKAEPLSEGEIRPFLAARAHRRGVTIDPAAARALFAFLGNDLLALDDAMERISLFVGDRKNVTEKDVLEVVDDSRMRSVFELTDAIGRRDAATAMATLSRLLGQGENAISLNQLVARQMKQLLVCAENRGASPEKLASLAGVPLFVSRKLGDQSRKFSQEEIRKAIRIAAGTDLDLKSSRLPDEMILDRAVLEMCMS